MELIVARCRRRQTIEGIMYNRSDVTVVITAYTLARWELTCQAIDSVLAQGVLPGEIIVCVDHNQDLLQRFRDHVAQLNVSIPSIRVVASKYDGHQASSRTTAVEVAGGEYLVFLDDDASADVGWLETMLRAFDNPEIVAVGGAPLPVYSKKRPSWFPYEFDWIFGCVYEGLPKSAEPVPHLIGTTMAARRDDLLAMGAFKFDAFEDMYMCHRLVDLFPKRKLLYQPEAIVHHYVHEDRLTWRYFWRRIFWVNRVKASVMESLGGGANLKAERLFVRRTLFRGTGRGLRQVFHGDPSGVLRAAAMVVGIGLAGTGYLCGLSESWLKRTFTRDPAVAT
jgi:glucosyl-dolichyl phosphate glucuronosyltransferase